MGDAPFFRYSAKRGYQNARGTDHTRNIISFIQHLNLRNSTVPQVITRMWHNARPRKVGTLIWLTLNKGLPVGTCLQTMGIQTNCKGCDLGLPKSAQHYLMVLQPHFGAKCENATHTPKSGKMESTETPKNSEDNLRGSNLLALVRSLY